MPTAVFTESVVFVVIDCADCHVQFAIPHEMQQRLRKNGQTFHCPNGHGQWYGKSEADRLREEVAAAEKRLKDAQRDLTWAKGDAEHYRERAKATERSLSAAKGLLTRTKNRIANGVCPCCNRHFTDLQRHMSGQHPDYLSPEDSPQEANASKAADSPVPPKRGRPRKVPQA